MYETLNEEPIEKNESNIDENNENKSAFPENIKEPGIIEKFKNYSSHKIDLQIPDNNFDEKDIIFKNGIAFGKSALSFLKLKLKPENGNVMVIIPHQAKNGNHNYSIKLSYLIHNGKWWVNVKTNKEYILENIVLFNMNYEIIKF